MPITLNCPSCGQAISAPDNAAGKQARCPKCQGIMDIPAAGAAGSPPADDPMAFLAGSKRVFSVGSPSASAHPAAASRPSQRYGAPAAGTAAAAECVLHLVDCHEDDEVGENITKRMRDVLKKEGIFESVALDESGGSFGKQVTVRSGEATVTVIPKGFFHAASVTVTATASVTTEHGDHEISATQKAADQRRGWMAMIGNPIPGLLKNCIKSVGYKLAREVYRCHTGMKRMRQDISYLAHWALFCGLVGIFPVMGFIMILPTLILAIIVFVWNSDRKEKVGLVEVGIAVVANLVGVVFSILVFTAGK